MPYEIVYRFNEDSGFIYWKDKGFRQLEIVRALYLMMKRGLFFADFAHTIVHAAHNHVQHAGYGLK